VAELWRLLLQAVQRDDQVSMGWCLELGVDPNARDMVPGAEPGQPALVTVRPSIRPPARTPARPRQRVGRAPDGTAPQAVVRGDAVLAKGLLELRADVNAVTAGGDTALTALVRTLAAGAVESPARSAELVSQLLNSRADVEARSAAMMTPLLLACCVAPSASRDCEERGAQQAPLRPRETRGGGLMPPLAAVADVVAELLDRKASAEAVNTQVPQAPAVAVRRVRDSTHSHVSLRRGRTRSCSPSSTARSSVCAACCR
jgi:hypothetical protein